MGKKSKTKKEGRRRASSIADHQRIGKSLVPPLLKVPNLSPHSWIDDRLPEMLWACLVITVLPRDAALTAFRSVAAVGFAHRGVERRGDWLLFHSQLPNLPPEYLHTIVRVVTAHPLGYAALRPLLLLEGLPGRELWKSLLDVEPQDDDWQTLGRAVLLTLDHQSQEATDVRWLSVLFLMGLGVMHFPEHLREQGDCIVEYPNRGDMRAVRPSIRATEGAIVSASVQGASQWPIAFWLECLRRTGCMPARIPGKQRVSYSVPDTIRSVLVLHAALVEHWFASLQSTSVDARHDTAFGFAFFCLSALLEMLVGRNGSGILARTLLRSIVECRITLAYLAKANSHDLWQKFRKFGTGQAKLALLKLDQVEGKLPEFVDPDVLERLANEDFYEEFIAIDLGHWCGSDLRSMAEKSGTKDDYDRIYGWASAYVHGHWSAIRDACMTHCFNPLHRLHRIPFGGHRMLEDAVPDAVALVNSVLADLSRIYPQFDGRVALIPVATKGRISSADACD